MRKSATETRITLLLAKCGFKPGQPWTELVEIAETIIDGEQKESPEMVGFVFQGGQRETSP